MKNDLHIGSIQSNTHFDRQGPTLNDDVLHEMSEVTRLRIASERKRLGLTQQEFADLVKIAKSYVSKLEVGSNVPGVWRHLRVFALAFGCTTDYLLGLSDERNVEDIGPVAEEKLILRLFRDCDQLGRAKLIAAAEELARLNSVEAREKRVLTELALIKEQAGDGGEAIAAAIVELLQDAFELEQHKIG
ncbi:MAG: helix-turn-helix domain-containing protein [Chloroflexota bacterium]